MKLRTSNGFVTRSIQRLHDLEINNVNHVDTVNKREISKGDNVEVTPSPLKLPESVDSPVTVTRFGRVSKPVKRLEI